MHKLLYLFFMINPLLAFIWGYRVHTRIHRTNIDYFIPCVIAAFIMLVVIESFGIGIYLSLK